MVVMDVFPNCSSCIQQQYFTLIVMTVSAAAENCLLNNRIGETKSTHQKTENDSSILLLKIN